MKKGSKAMWEMEAGNDRPAMTVGLDLGDRSSRYCFLNGEGEVVEEGRMQSTEAALRRHFEGESRLRIALECGTQSPWVSRLLRSLGHQVLVANPRKIPALTASASKNDRNDAELLARFAAADPRLLSPLRHRSLERQQDLNLIEARATLVRARTMIVNAVRGLASIPSSLARRHTAWATLNLETGRLRAGVGSSQIVLQIAAPFITIGSQQAPSPRRLTQSADRSPG